MLGPGDYAFQPTTYCNVNRTPVYAGTTGPHCLHYGDMLYLSESLLAVQKTRNPSWAPPSAGYMPNAQRLIVSVSDPRSLFDRVKNEYNTAVSGTMFEKMFLKDDGIFPNNARTSDIFAHPGFLSAFRMDAVTDWPTIGRTFDLAPFIRAFSALSKLRRMMVYTYSNLLTSNGNWTQYNEPARGTPSSNTYPVSASGVSASVSYEKKSLKDGSGFNVTSTSTDVTMTFSKPSWIKSFEILGCVYEATGYEYIGYSSKWNMTPLWFYESVGSGSTSVSVNKTAQDAQDLAEPLGIDTSSRYGYGVSVAARYLDVRFRYKHDI